MSQKRKPEFSIIMNVHNGEKYISEAIGSVLNQSFEDWELIIWDNKSFDKTNLIISKFEDERIKYFYSGSFNTLYEARNKAITKANGDLITILDCDDMWMPNKLAIQKAIMSNRKILFCYSNYFIISDKILNQKSKKAYRKKLPSGYIYNNLLKSYDLGLVTVCIRSSVFKKKMLEFNPNYTIIGDTVFFLELSKLGYAYYEDKCLAFYRWHSNNLSNNKLLLEIQETRNWLNKSNLSKEKRSQKYKQFYELINYQRAKLLSKRKISFINLLKLVLKINNNFLKIKFIIFYLLKKSKLMS